MKWKIAEKLREAYKNIGELEWKGYGDRNYGDAITDAQYEIVLLIEELDK